MMRLSDLMESTSAVISHQDETEEEAHSNSEASDSEES